MSPEEQEARGARHPNMVTRDTFISNIDRFHRPRCYDVTEEIAPFVQHQYADEPAL